MRCVYRLADNVQFSPSGVIHKAASHPVIHTTTSKADNGPKTLQRGQRAFTEYVRHSRPPYPVIRVLKQPALA